MKYFAEIHIMPRQELLDPQGKAVKKSLSNLEITGVQDVRIGKRIEMHLEAENDEQAREKVGSACQKLLANVIMETYEYELHVQETV